MSKKPWPVKANSNVLGVLVCAHVRASSQTALMACAGFRCWNDAFGADEDFSCVKGVNLVDCYGADLFFLGEYADGWGDAVVAESACVDGCWHEVMSEGVHGDEWG